MKLILRIICAIKGHDWGWTHTTRHCYRCGKEEGPL